NQTQVGMTQKRFLSDPAAAPPAGQLWQIPVCFELAPAGATPGRGYHTCSVVDRPEETFNVSGAACAPWVFANLDGRGYYRTEYSPEMLRAMAPHVEAVLTPPERLSLAGDEWAIVDAGRHHIGDYLTLASGFGREQTSGVMSMVVRPFGFIHDYLTTEANRSAFEGFIRTLLRPTFDELGMRAASNEPDDRRQLRAVVVASLGAIGDDPEVVRQSRATLDAALGGGPPLDATLADAVVTVAARHGDAKLYDALLSAAERATSPEEHYRYLYALPDFQDPALIDRGLAFAITPQLRSQDTAIYLSQFLGNPAARPTARRFIKEHWTELQPKLFVAEGDTNLVGSLSSFCDADAIADIKSFFSAHKLPTAARTLNQTLERISTCVARKDRQSAELAEWLHSQ